MKFKLFFLFVLICNSCLQVTSVQCEELSAPQLLEKNYLSNRLSDAKAEVSMVLRNKRGVERVRQLSQFSKLVKDGPDAMYALFFRSPADLKGTATLLIQQSESDDDMWIYLPALRKTRRLYSDNKRDSFMGSELSYGDILGYRPTEWQSSLIGEDVLDGEKVFLIEVYPVNESIKDSSGYSKRLLYLAQDSYLALKTEYWDDAGKRLKVITISDIKRLDVAGKFQFMKLQAENIQTGNHTTLIFDKYEYNKGLNSKIFTQRALERGIK